MWLVIGVCLWIGLKICDVFAWMITYRLSLIVKCVHVCWHWNINHFCAITNFLVSETINLYIYFYRSFGGVLACYVINFDNFRCKGSISNTFCVKTIALIIHPVNHCLTCLKMTWITPHRPTPKKNKIPLFALY